MKLEYGKAGNAFKGLLAHARVGMVIMVCMWVDGIPERLVAAER